MSRAITGPAITVTAERAMMGGRVGVLLRGDMDPAWLAWRAERVLDRLAAWAMRLTRFSPTSDLSRLNAAQDTVVHVRPTLAAAIDWGREAETATGGLIDIAMLDARLAAEAGIAAGPPPSASRRWSLRRTRRGVDVVRHPGVRFDLDGVAKGWLADRALDLLEIETALVDGDGDVALRVAVDDELLAGVADPRERGATSAVLRLRAADRPLRLGLATSGTTVKRWRHAGRDTHHLIDPASWRPAQTDVVQATVLATSARAAEAWAKAAVLAGMDRAPGILDRPGILGALLFTTGGEMRATPGMLPWLA